MDYIKPSLDYFSANPEWALVIIFLIAMGEAEVADGLGEEGVVYFEERPGLGEIYYVGL